MKVARRHVVVFFFLCLFIKSTCGAISCCYIEGIIREVRKAAIPTKNNGSLVPFCYNYIDLECKIAQGRRVETRGRARFNRDVISIFFKDAAQLVILFSIPLASMITKQKWISKGELPTKVSLKIVYRGCIL